MKHILFIYNPVAGTGKVKKNLYEIVDFYNSNNCLITLCPLIKLTDFSSALKFNEFDIIVCSGGDGTLSLLLSFYKQYHLHTPIAYVPSGSTNDYAYSLGIPCDFMKALSTTLYGNINSFDIGKFADKYFIYVAAFGIFTNVSYNTPQSSKNLLGHTAYILESIRQLSEIKSYDMTIQTTEQTYTGSFILGLVTNSLSIGGFKTLLPGDVKLDDGKFEVILIKKPQNIIELHGIISALVYEKLENNPHIIYFKTNLLKISTSDEVAWTLDGEYGGTQKEVEILNLSREIQIIS